MWLEKNKKKKKAAKDRHYAITVSILSPYLKNLILYRSPALGRVDQKKVERTQTKH
jgi:hypothetical protein